MLQDRVVNCVVTLPEISEKSNVSSGSGLVHARFLKHVAFLATMELVFWIKLRLPNCAIPAAAGHSDLGTVNDTV
jgi:hypothetical protein